MKKLVVLLVGAGIVIAALAAWFSSGWYAQGPVDEPTSLIVPEGTSVASLGRILAEDGNIAISPDRWRLLARVLGGSEPIKAGEFEIPAKASPAQILDIVQSAQAVQWMITIPEGMPSILVRERLAAAEHLTGKAPLPPEGSVLPQTYSYQRGESRAAVLKRMQGAMDEALDELWPTRTDRSVVDNKREAVILASIVEKETALASERREIAGVMANRLRTGMRLDADATTIYPITKGKPLGRRIRRSELDDPNAYNTRAIGGLPAGPIANPGRESIAAVLDPAGGDALYYVADGSGGHVFAGSLAEHNENVRTWRRIRRERGEL